MTPARQLSQIFQRSDGAYLQPPMKRLHIAITYHIFERNEGKNVWRNYNFIVKEENVIMQEGLKIISLNKKSKRKRITFIISLLIVFILLFSSLISFFQFGTANVFKSSIGLIRILTTDKAYVVIQKRPKRIVLAQPDYAWILFLSVMEEDGYIFLEEERMGAVCVFQKDNNRIMVAFAQNRFYSQWTWI